mgnify:CR=1 FL=1|jgi:hypothetical protein
MYYFYIHSVYGILGSNFLQSGGGLEFVQSILSSALKGKEIEDLFIIKSFTSLKSPYSIDSLTSFSKDANGSKKKWPSTIGNGGWCRVNKKPF